MQIRTTQDVAGWVRMYLTIWQGMLSLTERELELLCLIAERFLSLQQKVLDPDLLAEMLLSTSARQEMRQASNLSTNHFQNTLHALLEKQALRKTEGGHYQLNPKLVPQPELTFTFSLRD